MAKTGSERSTAHRKKLIEEGWRQKALLLPPDALKDLAAVKRRFDLPSEAEAVALGLRQLAMAASNRKRSSP